MRSWKFEIKDTFDNRMIAGIILFVLVFVLLIFGGCESKVTRVTEQDIKQGNEVVCKDYGGLRDIQTEFRQRGLRIQCREFFSVSNYYYKERD